MIVDKSKHIFHEEFEEKVFSFVSIVLRKRFYDFNKTNSFKKKNILKSNIKEESDKSLKVFIGKDPSSILTRAFCFICGKIDSIISYDSKL